MKARLAAAALALAILPAGAMPGFFVRDAVEPKESTAAEKAGSTCSLWARYDPDHVVWQEIHFLGGFSQCGGYTSFNAAASAAAAGLPTWQSYGYAKDSSPPGPTTGDTPYQCSVNVNFEPGTPATAQVVFTGAAACTVQRNRVLAVVKGSMTCMVSPAPCPWSNP